MFYQIAGGHVGFTHKQFSARLQDGTQFRLVEDM